MYTLNLSFPKILKATLDRSMSTFSIFHWEYNIYKNIKQKEQDCNSWLQHTCYLWNISSNPILCRAAIAWDFVYLFTCFLFWQFTRNIGSPQSSTIYVPCFELSKTEMRYVFSVCFSSLTIVSDLFLLMCVAPLNSCPSNPEHEYKHSIVWTVQITLCTFRCVDLLQFAHLVVAEHLSCLWLGILFTRIWYLWTFLHASLMYTSENFLESRVSLARSGVSG